MNTQITPINSVDYDFVLEIPAAELTPFIEQKLKKLRSTVQVKGFRKGKAPEALVKKMYGQEAAQEVVDKFVKDTFQDEVVENPAYDVIGQALMKDFTYEEGQDLKAVIRFGVAPKFELKDLTGENLSRLVNPVTDEDVTSKIDDMLFRFSNLVASEAPTGEKSVVTVDMQQADFETGEVREGAASEQNVQITMNDPQLLEVFRTALMGVKAGEQTEVRIEEHVDHGDHHHDRKELWNVTVQKVEEREYPEWTEEMIKQASMDSCTTLEELHDKVRADLQRERDARSNHSLRDKAIKRLIDLNPIEVPETMIERTMNMIADSYLKRVEEQYDGKLPQEFIDTFDFVQFREQRWSEAVNTTRFIFLRDALIERDNIAVTEEDWTAHFEQFLLSYPGLDMSFLRDALLEGERGETYKKETESQILSNKVLDTLVAQANVVDKSRADFEAESLNEDVNPDAADAVADFETVEGTEE